jgi:hypothetical protein
VVWYINDENTKEMLQAVQIRKRTTAVTVQPAEKDPENKEQS